MELCRKCREFVRRICTVAESVFLKDVVDWSVLRVEQRQETEHDQESRDRRHVDVECRMVPTAVPCPQTMDVNLRLYSQQER